MLAHELKCKWQHLYGVRLTEGETSRFGPLAGFGSSL